MKKALLLLALLLGVVSAKAATVEDICGYYNVDNFSGYESYWFHNTTDWQEFSYSDYTVKIFQIEGNTVALRGLFGPDFIGEFNPEQSCIVFPAAALYDGDSYYFCKETMDETGKAWTLDLEQTVVAPIDENGNITLDGFTILYDYKTGKYFSYFSGVKTSLSPTVPDVEEICGVYNVDSFKGYEAGWFTDDYNWNKFDYDGYQVEISPAGDGKVYLTNLLYSNESLVADYDPVDYTLTFPAQTFSLGDYSYIFCKEEWDGSSIVCDMNSSIVAQINSDNDAIAIDGWTLLYDYGNGSYWTYFSGVTSVISPYVEAGDISNVEEIVGNYTVDSWAGNESYWFTASDYDWHAFSYGNYEAKVVLEGDNLVSICDLMGCEEAIIGEFDPEQSAIVIPAQTLTIDGYDYIFCKEEWGDNGAVCNMDNSVLATIDANRKIHLDGWTLLYNMGTYYWGYFYGVTATLSPNFEPSVVTDIIDTNNDAPVHYYDINGFRVNNIDKPGLYIVRQGDKVTKRIIR